MFNTLNNSARAHHLDSQDPLARARYEAEMARNGKSGELEEIKDAAIAKGFMLAGDCRVTLEDQQTEEHVIWNIACAKDDQGEPILGMWFVKLFTGRDLQKKRSWTNTGYIVEGKGKWAGRFFFNLGRNVRFITENNPKVQDLRYVLRSLDRRELPKGINILRGNKCGRCRRKLSVPTSIRGTKSQEKERVLNKKYGIGPVCRKLLNYMG